jgi:hypothetical protein
MRMMTMTLAALGVIGAVAVGAPSPSAAQGIYLEGPGVEFGVGPRYHYRDYRYYDGPRVYERVRPGWYGHRYYRSHRWDWD